MKIFLTPSVIKQSCQMTNPEVCADKNSVCVRDGASREEILCNVSSSTKDERHLTSGQDTGNNAQPSDKPAWLDHIGRPQEQTRALPAQRW
jgi:hypothetical protein